MTFQLFQHVSRDDFGLVQPGDFDPDLDMIGEMTALDQMCRAHLGRPFDECVYVDAATFISGDPESDEINDRYVWCAAGGGRKLEGFDANCNYFLVECEEASYIFARWEFDSVFVVSNLPVEHAA